MRISLLITRCEMTSPSKHVTCYDSFMMTHLLWQDVYEYFWWFIMMTHNDDSLHLFIKNFLITRHQKAQRNRLLKDQQNKSYIWLTGSNVWNCTVMTHIDESWFKIIVYNNLFPRIIRVSHLECIQMANWVRWKIVRQNLDFVRLVKMMILFA